MKKQFFFALALILLGISVPAVAQDAASVIARYTQAAGLSKTDLDKTNLMTKMTVTNMGMKIPYTIVMSNPTNRMRVEMEMNGQKMLIVVSGNQGWLAMPNVVQPLPADQIGQMKKQLDILSGLKWAPADFDLTLLPSVTENGKKYDVVKAKAKKEGSSAGEQILYFDNATGLIAFIESMAPAGGQVAGRITFGNYKTLGSYKYPSEIKFIMAQKEVGGLTVDSLILDYPIKDEMFAQPK